jgi:putative peptidoglycan lipid II flippase
VFGIAIATAALPTLATHAAKNDHDRLVEDFAFSLRLTLALLIPSMVGMIVLARPVVRLLFERGEFTAARSTPMTVDALVFYAAGLFAYGGTKVVVQAFYSLKDTVTPMKVAASIVGLNVALNLILVRYMGLRGLALATAISAAVGFSALCLLLRRRLRDIRGGEIWKAVGKVVVVSCPVGISLHLVSLALEPLAVDIWGKLLQVGVSVVVGGAVLLAAGLALRVEEITFLLKILAGSRLRR